MNSIESLVVCLFLLLGQNTCSAAGYTAHDLSSCLLFHGVKNFSFPTSPSYTTLLNYSINNLRFMLTRVRKPVALVLPDSREGLCGAVLCTRDGSLAIRVRSGGHSFEGLSYTTENDVPFVVIDLMNLNRVQVDPDSATAWAESGTILGELYYAVGQSSQSLAFSAGSSSTIGLGGIISGGGFGMLSRKFALAADNVLDVVLIDPSGRTLDRSSMGDDVFWAIRGGGGGSWGVVYAWKLQLVAVPRKIAVFALSRTGPVELIAGLIYRWQFVGPYLPDDFYISLYLPTGSSDGSVSVLFEGQVLGSKDDALSLLTERFPELECTSSDLLEISWVESTAKFAGLSSVADLPNRGLATKFYSKRKSDYVRTPISRHDMVNIIRYLSVGPHGSFILYPYGGAMAQIGSDNIPFPHRAGNLYSIQYGVYWDHSDNASEYIGWLRKLHMYMTPYVSKNPRSAYVNCLDLDMGVNNWSHTVGGSSNEAIVRARSSWGMAYFGRNFDRLVKAKTLIDPFNVFNNAQSIPPS
ncbi:hypothetical protein ACP4OV_028080 [Aristida adscensionis]